MKDTFREEILKGLRSEQKTLPSKYFYDQNGDKLFQEIMELEEYYLPRCEKEIIEQKSGELTDIIGDSTDAVDIIELGAGDGTKTKDLLAVFLSTELDCTYIPMDISGHILGINKDIVSANCPDLKIIPIAGDYFHTMTKIKERNNVKLVLFLGSNIGNYKFDNAVVFLEKVKSNLDKDDYLLVAFDLKKHPRKILAAYDDSQGVTKKFNLNLLQRINTELTADFDLESFDHYASYDPITGRTNSFLISLKEQSVNIGKELVKFDRNESIHTEVSRKYSLKDIEQLAKSSGFKTLKHLMDNNKEYTLSLFQPY
ncbi:MAG: L-histidine N(alpha)-methyltransferase [Brumimicrobium sp.]|nr:L-histidine N(alpha)-methyltransferase [Brumimicrobium sp.]